MTNTTNIETSLVCLNLYVYRDRSGVLETVTTYKCLYVYRDRSGVSRDSYDIHVYRDRSGVSIETELVCLNVS